MPASVAKSLAASMCGLILLALIPSVAVSFEAMPPGSLQGVALVSANPREIEDWAAQPFDQPYPLPLQTRFKPGETAFAAVLVTGYSRDDDQNVDLDASFRFYNYDGKLLFRRDAFAKLKRFVSAETGFLLLRPALDIAFSAEDPPGEYRLEFEINDNIARHRTRTRQSLTLDGR